MNIVWGKTGKMKLTRPKSDAIIRAFTGEEDCFVKKILLIATGGTIASRVTVHGLAPSATSQELLTQIQEAGDFCQLDTMQLLNIDSTNIQPEQWVLMAEAIEQRYDDYDGFVIAHGTDTMAYTAAALSYLIQNPDKPIVLTGSQKPLFAPISDAKKNLLDSLRFACQPGICGVYLVFSGVAILGTRAKKLKTKSYSAFSSINYPEVAVIDGSRVITYLRSGQTAGKPVQFFHELRPSVILIKLIPGMNPDILDYAGEHYEAIVLESYGSGGLPFADKRNFLEKLEHLEKLGRVVVIATQAMLEGSDLAVYEVGNLAMQRYNLMQTYDMTIESVVTKLMWLLAQNLPPEELKKKFYTPIANDILYPEPEK